MISNFDFNFVGNPIPAAPWRQSQISLATVGWHARFDSRRVRQALIDFEPQGALLLAFFERWDVLGFPPHVLPWLAGSMRISMCFLIE
jgi:hypothetical protein